MSIAYPEKYRNCTKRLCVAPPSERIVLSVGECGICSKPRCVGCALEFYWPFTLAGEIRKRPSCTFGCRIKYCLKSERLRESLLFVTYNSSSLLSKSNAKGNYNEILRLQASVLLLQEANVTHEQLVYLERILPQYDFYHGPLKSVGGYRSSKYELLTLVLKSSYLEVDSYRSEYSDSRQIADFYLMSTTVKFRGHPKIVVYNLRLPSGSEGSRESSRRDSLLKLREILQNDRKSPRYSDEKLIQLVGGDFNVNPFSDLVSGVGSASETGKTQSRTALMDTVCGTSAGMRVLMFRNLQGRILPSFDNLNRLDYFLLSAEHENLWDSKSADVDLQEFSRRGHLPVKFVLNFVEKKLPRNVPVKVVLNIDQLAKGQAHNNNHILTSVPNTATETLTSEPLPFVINEKYELLKTMSTAKLDGIGVRYEERLFTLGFNNVADLMEQFQWSGGSQRSMAAFLRGVGIRSDRAVDCASHLNAIWLAVQ